MGPTGSTFRILQIHPTRRCNLRCLHCYSASGPEQRGELAPELLCGALSDARNEGYTVVSVSGGEPLMYAGLKNVLQHAHECGLVTTVTTNGMLLNDRRLAQLQGVVDLLAISLDGVPSSHNRMRSSEHAFPMMEQRLEGVRRSGIPFGFIFTLTQHNIHELDWVAAFALEHGATLLQVHPLEIVGRAEAQLPTSGPDSVEAGFAYLEVLRIQAEVGDRLHLHLDLADQQAFLAEPERAYAGDTTQDALDRRLADLTSPLVIEADGTVVPLQYGFVCRYALGNLLQTPLREMAPVWRREVYPSFRRLCRQVYERAVRQDHTPLFNWYDAMLQGAAAPSA